jgi:esterase/lipase superfamily enzyme
MRGESVPRKVQFTGDRQTRLSYGAAAVHIPKDHKIGRIEIPKGYSILGIDLFEESPNEDKHFIINHVATLSEQEWDDQLKAQKADTALVFVHGFNTTFEEALLRNAQIVFDLQFKGLSVLYSWSSRGGFENYRYDLDSAYSARAGFITLLTKLRDDFHIKRINVLAHSMGNVLVLDSLVNNANSKNPVSLDQLIMAAPDVARDVFKTQVSAIQKLSGGTTLYASGADIALALSKRLAVYPRAGDVPDDGPVVLPGMDTIDVTEIGDELLGFHHSEFATNRAVMDDIGLLLNNRIYHPPRLTQVRPFPEPPKVSTYWRYAP